MYQYLLQDNCQFVSSFDQADTDVDGEGDACDSCPSVAISDLVDSNLMSFQCCVQVLISFTG